MMALVSLSEKTSESPFSLSLSLSLSLLCEVTEKRQLSTSQKVASPEANHVDILILNHYPPEMRENKFLFFKPLSLWDIVMAV